MPFLEDYFVNYKEFFEKYSLAHDSNEVREDWLKKQYSILLGYYSILDLEGQLHYYLSKNYKEDNVNPNLVVDYEHEPIIDSNWVSEANQEQLFNAVRKHIKNQNKLEEGINTPKFYQHFNYPQLKNTSAHQENLVHNLYLNTNIQKGLNKYEAQVVLAEEILFFIFFKEYELNGLNLRKELTNLLFKEIKTQHKNVKFNFHQLVKYASSIEAKLYEEKLIESTNLNNYFEIRNTSATFYDSNTWGTENEGTYRGVIDETIARCNRSDIDNILCIIEAFYGKFKAYLYSQPIIQELNLDIKDSLADIVSRFDINTIKSIWQVVEDECMWDILVFPMYKSFRYNNVKIATLPFSEEVTINNPVLFHSFVKSVYRISDGEAIDESLNTLFGFHLTKEVCKHYSKQIIEDVFVRQTIQHSLLQPQIINAIAVIMSRNLSHTDGSHVMVDFENSISKPLYEIDNSLVGEKLTKEEVTDLNEKIKDSSAHFNEQFKLYNEHLRNTMELVADVSGKIGIQSNYEYCLKDFFTELEDKYFAQKTTPKQRKNLKRQSRFLGRGLNDGEGCSIFDASNIRFIIKDDNKYKDNDATIRALFPGGENGKIAFVSILKNIFRNLKKHSGFKKDNTVIENLPYYQLEVNIIEDEFNKDYYKLELKETTHTHQLDKTTDTDGKVIEGIKTKISRIRNHLLIDNIINADGTEKSDGWGLLEMRICAAYLIGLPIEEYQYDENETVYQDSQGKKYPMHFIDVDKVKGENGKYYLCHYLYLRKPKFATVWLEKKDYETIHNEKNETRLKELSDNGFTIKKIGEEKEHNSPSKFILGDETSEKTEPHYNFRVLDKRISYDLISQDINEIKEAVANEWIQANAYPIDELFYYDFNNDENTLAIKKWNDNQLIFESSYEGPAMPTKNLSKVALLDNHFGYFKKLVGGYDGGNVLEYLKSKFSYLENNSSKNESRKAFSEAKKYEVLECLNTSVTIFDERIQKHLLNTEAANSGGWFTLKEINELKGIYTADFSLKEFFYESVSTMEELIKHLEESFNKSKYIVLHFSGFEKVVERSELTIDEANIKLYDLTKGKPNYIIFTSGKGIPKTLPKKCFFIPYSTLKVLIEKKPKFDLITALNSIRLIKL
jgi:hypothetical protein